MNWQSRFSDRELALVISAVLFVLAAWPLLLTDVPPLQDLPNHLATATVLLHPERYPGLVFNGFLKTNAALFAWLYLVGRLVGLKLASRLFVAIVLATGALVLPRLVLELTGSRARMIASAFFAWPFVHDWFVSMGMLDYALAVPLSLFALLLLDRQRRAWTWRRAVAIALVGLATWYAHVFPLLVVHLLVGVHAATRETWRARAHALRLFVPLVPAAALALTSVYSQLTEPAGAMQGFVRHWTFLPPWELAYNLWAQWLWGFTWLSISSFVVAIGLAYVAVTRCREDAPFFGRWALAVLFGAYLVLPYAAGNWFHVGSRLIPYLWVAALVRVPDTLDRRVTALLAASAALYSAGMGLDYVRLDRDRAELTAGMSAVPEGSRLLPLLFRHKRTSENTRSLLHAWGFYVMEKLTDAPLLFACSRSFPLTYREPPPTRFHHLVLEWFAHDMRTPESSCRALRDAGVVVDCEDLYRSAWADFWRDATPRYDRVLLWEPTAEAIAQLPRAYEVAFRSERLTILARRAEATSAP